MDSSFTFEYPVAFLFPLLLIIVAWLRQRSTQNVPFPSNSILSQIDSSWRQKLRTPILTALSLLTLLSLALAAARPVEILSITEEKKRRNIILCLDVSKSMEYPDFSMNGRRAARLTAIKHVISKFIPRRVDDRLGMVIFGSSSYLQVPLTLDHELVLKFLESLRPGIAGGGTAIGDGLGLSVKRIREIPGLSKAVILVTDGVNNSGSVNPIQAAKLAKSLDIKVHTIGVGSARNREFDEKTLKKIAKTTGGVYFNAQNTERLSQIYDQIDQLERSNRKETQSSVRKEHFWKFALAGLALYLLYFLAARTIFLVVP